MCTGQLGLKIGYMYNNFPLKAEGGIASYNFCLRCIPMEVNFSGREYWVRSSKYIWKDVGIECMCVPYVRISLIRLES